VVKGLKVVLVENRMRVVMDGYVLFYVGRRLGLRYCRRRGSLS
jgi:hypothetical protein